LPPKGVRDPIWDSLEAIFGRVVSGTNAAHKRNKACKDLRLLGATPQSIAHASSKYRQAFSGAAMTDVALATHYPMLAPREVAPACPECGVSAPMHASDCSHASR
jgi:hypothetical protein